MKAPPNEKPPPVPPTSHEKEKLSTSSITDDDIDKQEMEIIASLEMEEREHKRYMETQERMKRKYFPSCCYADIFICACMLILMVTFGTYISRLQECLPHPGPRNHQ